jgi:STE24 endopeptidase
VNAYGAIVLVALLVGFVLERVADWLNLRALTPEPPPEFRDLYDRERYARAREYLGARTRFGIVTAAIDLVLLLAVWFAGGFGWVDRLARALADGPILRGLIFLGTLGLGRFVLTLPLRWWSTFVVEARFGFNRTTPRTFWTDAAKGLILAILLGTPLLTVVLWLFETTGDRAWLWCWLVAALYLVGVELVAPSWILPLFNRFTPLAGTLRETILAYARSVGFPLEGVFVIDGSRRSTKANAFFTGFGRRKRIALFDTLVETLQPDEVVAVVAHEVGHYKRRHVLQGTVLGIVHLGAMLFLLAWILPRRALFEAFFVDEPSVWAGLVLFGLLAAPVELVLSVVLHAWSRRNEYAADRFAVETTGAGERLASALKRLSADSHAHLTPHPFYVALHYSHPPVLARIRALHGEA